MRGDWVRQPGVRVAHRGTHVFEVRRKHGLNVTFNGEARAQPALATAPEAIGTGNFRDLDAAATRMAILAAADLGGDVLRACRGSGTARPTRMRA
jgi:hypothetical protein